MESIVAGSGIKISSVLPALFVVGLMSCGGDRDYDNLIVDLKSASIETRRSAIFELHRRGKQSIPKLIADIADDKKIPLNMQNPTSSYIHRGSLVNFSGVLSAYVIELILARAELYWADNSNPDFLLGAGNEELHNYIYDGGIIVRKDGDDLGYFDMITVRNIYRNWWNDNGHKTIEQLRDDWWNYDTPLAGSDYSWY
jgi:hypothetical protein